MAHGLCLCAGRSGGAGLQDTGRIFGLKQSICLPAGVNRRDLNDAPTARFQLLGSAKAVIEVLAYRLGFLQPVAVLVEAMGKL